MCQVTSSICVQHAGEKSYAYLLFAGFDSFIGELIRVLRYEEIMLELKYRHCSSGHATFFRCSFSQSMVHAIQKIHRSQFSKLQKAYVHKSFCCRERASHEVRKPDSAEGTVVP